MTAIRQDLFYIEIKIEVFVASLPDAINICKTRQEVRTNSIYPHLKNGLSTIFRLDFIAKKLFWPVLVRMTHMCILKWILCVGVYT